MSWRTDWKAISDRIASVLDAGSFYAQMSKVYSSDAYNAAQALIANANEIFVYIEQFGKTYSGVLPSLAASRLSEFVRSYAKYFTAVIATHDERFQRTQFALTMLASFRSEFVHLLADSEAEARSLVDRAFLHLQRSIVADKTVATLWREAFDNGEEACERLGGAHLLLFGVYSFKASSAGERTDLILGGPPPLEEVRRGAEALVLTEWKRVSKPADISKMTERAYQQAKRYAGGSLAGFELERYRFLVMVSEDVLRLPDDRVDGLVTYQYRNVAVRPSYPSKVLKN